SVNENGGSLTVTVTRTNGSDGAVTVDYATSDGTATAGSDYSAKSGTLSFANGEVSKTFVVAILDDTIYEGNETINLTLSNPTGGDRKSAVKGKSVNIADDEKPQPDQFQFSAAGYSVNEKVDSLTWTHTRTSA